MRLVLLVLSVVSVAVTPVVLAGAASAQAGTVGGTVRDDAGQPLPGVSVYLSGTTRGAAADAAGRYRISAVAPGSYRLVGSMVGYQAQAVPVRVAPGAAVQADLRLTPVVETLGAVQVEARADRRWQRRLARFERVLLGESDNAEQTRVLNPEVLELTSSWGTLRATAGAPLVIENRALGYRLSYDLHAFSASASTARYDGDEVFEEMTPASEAEATRWAAARRRAYRGSLPHLLRSLIAGVSRAEGFSLAVVATPPFRHQPPAVPRPVSGDRLVRVDADGWATLTVRGELEVTYDGEPEEAAYLRSDWFRGDHRRPDDRQRSTLSTSRRGARLDPQGTPVDPFAVSTTGHLAFERLADRVPRDYEPPVLLERPKGP